MTCSVASCVRPVKTRGWCQAHYMRWWCTGRLDEDRPIQDKRTGERVRFLDAFTEDESGCWLWRNRVGSKGYAYFTRDSGHTPRTVLAHRFAYEMMVGPIPDGAQLDHLCHNEDQSCAGGWKCRHRSCVNPAHLEPVSQSVNQKRGRIGDRNREKYDTITHCPQGHPYDEGNTYRRPGFEHRTCRECSRQRARARSLRAQGMPDTRRKITDAQITEIVRLAAAGVRNADISRQTGVGLASVSRIRNGKQRSLP